MLPLGKGGAVIQGRERRRRPVTQTSQKLVTVRATKRKNMRANSTLTASTLIALSLGCSSHPATPPQNGEQPPAAAEHDEAPVATATNIAIDGSSTVYPITEAVAEEFQKGKDVRVTIGVSGTGGGFKKFCKGEI